MRNYIFLAIAAIVVYFVFFKKPKDEKATTPTTPTGGGGTNTGTTTVVRPPYQVGETRLKLKNGASSYYIGDASVDYTNTTGAPVMLGGKVKQRGVENGVAGYILTFNTPNGIEERAFYETDLTL